MGGKQSRLDGAAVIGALDSKFGAEQSRIAHRPGSSLHQKLPFAIAFKMSSFLDTPSLAQLSKTEYNARVRVTKDLAEKKRVSEELLHHVFQANPKAVAEFFNRPGALKRMILTKTCYREGYFSRKQKKFICFRHWGLVSPLQAAALCGDNFLVKELLSILLRPDPSPPTDAQAKEAKMLREEALRQLQEVLNRKAAQPAVLHAPAAARAAAAPEPAAAGAVAGHEGGADPDRKRGAEDKRSAEASANTEFADAAEYLNPFKELIKAYREYIAVYVQFKDWDKRDEHWERVGECQKRIPRYGLQEFFDAKRFEPIPDFNRAPHRGKCRYRDDNRVMNLDSIGLRTKLGIYSNGYYGTGVDLIPSCELYLLGRAFGKVNDDLDVISGLCELRLIELGTIIDCLRTHEDVLALIEGKSTSVRPIMS